MKGQSKRSHTCEQWQWAIRIVTQEQQDVQGDGALTDGHHNHLKNRKFSEDGSEADHHGGCGEHALHAWRHVDLDLLRAVAVAIRMIASVHVLGAVHQPLHVCGCGTIPQPQIVCFTLVRISEMASLQVAKLNTGVYAGCMGSMMWQGGVRVCMLHRVACWHDGAMAKLICEDYCIISVDFM
jgi:hypothetical protein